MTQAVTAYKNPQVQEKKPLLKRYYIKTFGCQMNYSDSERVSALLTKMGWRAVETPEESDMIIFNTCSIRQKAEDRVVGAIRNYNRMKKENPHLKIGVTGCMVRKTGVRSIENNAEESEYFSSDKLFKLIPGLDFVFRIEETPKLEKLMFYMYPQDEVEEHFKDYNSYFHILPKYESKVQAFVPIMRGCNNYCSFCIVPYSRGREVYRPLDEIIREVEELASQGLKELTLLGQNVNSYRLDKAAAETFAGEREQGKSDFVILLQEVNKVPGIKRIRYTSSHPKDFDDDLIEAHATLENLCKHVHLAVQSGDDGMLKRMNRHHTYEEYTEKMRKLREKVPGVCITTDIIVGFCGETEEEFENTVKLVNEVKFDVIYIAQYSSRKGTFAGDRMDDNIPHKVKAERWHTLNEILKDINNQKNPSYVNSIVEVLVEEEKDGTWIGKTEDWKTVHFPKNSEENLIGQLVDVKIDDWKTWILLGTQI